MMGDAWTPLVDVALVLTVGLAIAALAAWRRRRAAKAQARDRHPVAARPSQVTFHCRRCRVDAPIAANVACVLTTADTFQQLRIAVVACPGCSAASQVLVDAEIYGVCEQLLAAYRDRRSVEDRQFAEAVASFALMPAASR